MNDLARKKRIRKQCVPLDTTKKKKAWLHKRKKKKLSHENERRLIEHHHQTIEDKSEVGGPQTAL